MFIWEHADLFSLGATSVRTFWIFSVLMDAGTPASGGEADQTGDEDEVCSCQIVAFTDHIYVKHLHWRRAGGGGGGGALCHLHANSAITPTFFTMPTHLFTSFTSLFKPAPPSSSPEQLCLSLSSDAPSLQVSFAPSAAFYSLFRNQPAPGQKLCCSLCLPVGLHLFSPSCISHL